MLDIEEKRYSVDQIFSADESKMEYELGTKRTLTAKGQKEVTRTCGKETATTHTFTMLVSYQLVTLIF